MISMISKLYIYDISANITNLFQPLDLTVTSSAKAFLNKKFTEWYDSSFSMQLKGKSIEDIDVELKPSLFKPLHRFLRNAKISSRHRFLRNAIHQQ